MPRLEVITRIAAPVERCFWLALSVEAHVSSTAQTQEQVVGGVRPGLLQFGDSVSFRARHFGVWQTLTSKITAYQAPAYFCDEMQRGAFKRMRHEHYFEPTSAGTLMRDVFDYTALLGWLGRVADKLVLENYLRRFLTLRGEALQQLAETEAWREFVPRE